MLTVTSAAGLGTPTADGTQALLRVGSAPARQEILTWNLAQQAWIGKPTYTVRMIDQMPMIDINSGYIQQKAPDNEPPQLNDQAVGFQLEPVPDAKLFWDAGLRLQEKLTGEIKWNQLSTNPFVYVNWYEFDVGTSFLAPVPTNPGVVLNGIPLFFAASFASTGWQNSPIAAPTHATWYPELYGANLVKIARFNAQRRWVYGAITGGITSDGSAKAPPIRDFLEHWYQADDIPQANGTSVALWPDQSGRGNHFVQTTSTAQPTLTRNTLNGKAVVSFDGSTDYMLSTGGGAQPVTIYLVLRQRAGGTDPQVWLDGRAASFLVYRGSSTDQVDVYAGGASGDLIYHRGSNWPSPYMVWSGSFSGDTTTIWENKTLVATGGGGQPGTGGPSSGFMLGARRTTNDLQASIDVAEMLMYLTNHNSTQRNQTIDYLNAKYNLF